MIDHRPDVKQCKNKTKLQNNPCVLPAAGDASAPFRLPCVHHSLVRRSQVVRTQHYSTAQQIYTISPKPRAGCPLPSFQSISSAYMLHPARIADKSGKMATTARKAVVLLLLLSLVGLIGACKSVKTDYQLTGRGKISSYYWPAWSSTRWSDCCAACQHTKGCK